MKTKTFRKVMGAVLAFALVVTGLKFGEIKAVAGDPVEGTAVAPVDYSVQTAENDSVFVTKSAIALGDDNVKIEFEVKDKNFIANDQSTGDVIIVLDASGTMQFKGVFEHEQKAAKEIAKQFTDKGIKVGVVSFETVATTACEPTTDYHKLQVAINTIKCVTGEHYSNLQAGLHEADKLLGNTKGGRVILLSDGQANYCYRPYEAGDTVRLYNLESTGNPDKELIMPTGFIYINPWKVTASLNYIPSTYLSDKYLDANENEYAFINEGNTQTTKYENETVYYQLTEDSKAAYANKEDEVYCVKYTLSKKNNGKGNGSNKGEFVTDGKRIKLTRWNYDLITKDGSKLDTNAYKTDSIDQGLMTISEAYSMKKNGRVIYTVTYPNYRDGKTRDIDKYYTDKSYEKYVMTNVSSRTKDGAFLNCIVDIKKDKDWVNNVLKKFNLIGETPANIETVTITDTLPSYLSYDEADAQNVVSKTVAFDDNGVAKFEFTAKLDKPAMIAAYRANTSIGKVSADASKIWIDMNKAASVAYGTETINVPNPKLPFGIWNVNVEYQVEVPDSTGFNTEYKVVTAPAVQLFETETYTIKNVDGYDVTNQAKFKEPFVITTYSKGVDVVSPSDNKVKNSIGSKVNFDGESRNVYVFVGYDLKSYTVSFYNENGDGIIEKLIPSVEPVIPVADAPVNPQPAEQQPEEGQPEEGQQEGNQQENGQRVILIPVGEITRDPEITSEPAIMPRDPAPTAPVEGENGEDDEEEGFPEIPSSFTSVYEVYTVQVKYGVRISDGSMAEANAHANIRAGRLNDERHANVQFAGWTNADKTSAGTALIAPITGDLNVYASYTSEDVFFVTYKQYDTVPFDTVSNYGDPIHVVSGGSHTVLTTGPALSGYEFKGWSLSDAEDAAVLDVTIIENITADVVLFPVYEKLPDPVDPTPVDPTPVDPTPVDPTPVDPTPVDPTPVNPTPVDPAPVNPTPSYPNPTPVDPEPAKQPELDMGTEGTPLGDTNVKEPQVITYEGEPESELPGMEILDDGQALGDAVLPKTGTMPVPVFYVTGGLLAALAGILFFVKKRH